MSTISRGFHGKRPATDPSRIPPGQHLVRDFPVLSAGPTPHTALSDWSFTIRGAVETPVSETEGTVGFPQIVEAENYVINNHLGDVISQSFDATEQTLPNAQAIYNLRSDALRPRRH